ncbi:uncharacterized protein [Clytia hemisphaerica]|uniref:Cnidarian restricted protein n=1 Tax=Clytia hemisphaerica TaxID=252671 RepID=A0A7M5WZ38_9CNID
MILPVLLMLFQGLYLSDAVRCEKRKPQNMHGIKPQVSIKEMKSGNGGLIKILPVLSPEWELSFKFKINSFDFNNFKRVIRITNGQSYPVYGFATPSVLMYQTMLQVSSAVNDSSDFTFKKWGMALNTVYNLKVSQYYVADGKYRYTVFLDGVEVLLAMNAKPTQFYNTQIHVLEGNGADCDVTDLRFIHFL